LPITLIGEMLIDDNLVTLDDVEKALQIQKSVGGRIGGLLVRVGALSEDQLLQILSRQLGLEYLRKTDQLPDNLLVYQFMMHSPIKLDWFINHSVLVWRDKDQICCIARDILSTSLIEVLGYFYPTEAVRFFLAVNHQIDRMLDFVKKEHAVEELFSGENSKLLREMAEEAPIIELVNNLLSQAVDVNASDIHVEPNDEYFVIRLRIDGVLHTQMTQPVDRFPAVASRIKLVAGIDIAERRLPQDGRITTRISGQEMDIRVSTVPTIFGESIVLRLLPKERDDLALVKLGMESDHLELFRSWVMGSNGIVLITGPTGSGKSTTLYAALNDSNDGVRKIITVEDPVENQIPSITQIQAHSEIGYTFARALRAILRQDPDVIMIGEIRDLETAEIAIQSALTGHLVLSTIHTNDAVSAFTRLIDMGIEPFLVSAPMRGVQAQRLIRKVCSYCKVNINVPSKVFDSMANLPSDLIGERWVQAKGCDACHQTGYSGRMGIYELVPMSSELQDMIVAGASLNDIRHYAESQGYRTLYQDGLLKASRGLTTLEEVARLTIAEH
jgi:general secretion pathway protein E